MHWTEAEYRDYKARVQLPLGRRVQGLERPKRVNTSALEWQEAERLTKWRDEEGIKIFPELQFLHHIPNGGFRHKAVAGKMKAQVAAPIKQARPAAPVTGTWHHYGQLLPDDPNRRPRLHLLQQL
jgi:hypothetical protein